ncbi:GNAT family N-acetyltransferase [Idiomarina sp. HP20-50]|uniref:GNAT family N-acetyltransferase n=1 Tax=Idiomarina sp. HP20-50 TaxID=3070813 RepID=UPI00294B7248|nr:GNAT family N-acetyltransferase [Idiomarina sp. HP20-50]MDV6316601.1 GNAT family N-acetyltransferase [Idiomarina sp. HP20-50]
MQAVIHSTITTIPEADWNRLFKSDYPFTRYDFLLALEQGGSLGPQRGWLPQYVVVNDDNGTMIAAMPWFKKTHSYGEYLFDWAFAEAFERYGFQYYPKLINAIPFTPCQGPRLATAEGVKPGDVLAVIESALLQAHDVSNLQSLYVEPDVSHALTDEGWWQRFDLQFLWQNRNYGSFDDFLAALVSRKRKSIRKERQKISEHSVQMRTLHGHELTADFWRQFTLFYQRTYLKRSGHGGYLTPATFKLWGEHLADKIVVFAAYRNEEMLAASLCFKDEDTLYGRYWGCQEELEFLHFEACYYQGIEYCINHGLGYFDAGAQGEHKLHRGFEPVLREGFYRFNPSPLNEAIEQYCRDERTALNEHLKTLQTYLPYKAND